MFRRISSLPLTLTLTLGLFACLDEVAPSDGPDDSFLHNGKADGLGIVEGSSEAISVLAVVNENSIGTLDDEVGLDSRAAANIVAHRDGSDETPMTADDDLFDSLLELDEISYVGPVALERLLAYAYANGYVNGGQPLPIEREDQAAIDFVNEASLEILDDSAEVGLDSRAAANIVAHRNGPDGLLGTGDDDFFGSIAELDAIPYVGQRALEAIRQYALAHGYLQSEPELESGDYRMKGCGIGFESGRSLTLRSVASKLFVMDSSKIVEVDDDNSFSFVTLEGCSYKRTIWGDITVTDDKIDVLFNIDDTQYLCVGTTRRHEKYTLSSQAHIEYDRASGSSAACQVKILPVRLEGTASIDGSSEDSREVVILKEFEGKRTISWKEPGSTQRWSDNVEVREDGRFETHYYSDAAQNQIQSFNGRVADGLIEVRYGSQNLQTGRLIMWEMLGFYDSSSF